MRLIGQNGMAKVLHAGPENIVKAVSILTGRGLLTIRGKYIYVTARDEERRAS